MINIQRPQQRAPNLKKNKAIVLLSGGLDSTATLAIAKNQGFEVYVLSFDYGKRHRVEMERAQIIAQKLEVTNHKVITIDLRQLGGSALTDSIDIPTNRDEKEMSSEIPIIYVPNPQHYFPLLLSCLC